MNPVLRSGCNHRFHPIRSSHQGMKQFLKGLSQLPPGTPIQAKALQNRQKGGIVMSGFVLPNRPACPVQKFQIIPQGKCQALGRILPVVTHKGQQLNGLDLSMQSSMNALAHRSVFRLFRCDRQFCPHRVQIHIGHASQQRRFIQQGLGFETPLPEPSGAAVLRIGLEGNSSLRRRFTACRATSMPCCSEPLGAQ